MHFPSLLVAIAVSAFGLGAALALPVRESSNRSIVGYENVIEASLDCGLKCYDEDGSISDKIPCMQECLEAKKPFRFGNVDSDVTDYDLGQSTTETPDQLDSLIVTTTYESIVEATIDCGLKCFGKHGFSSNNIPCMQECLEAKGPLRVGIYNNKAVDA